MTDRAAFDAQMQEHRSQLQAGIAEAGAQGRDAKALSDEVEEGRRRVAEERLRQKQAYEAQLAQENEEMREVLENTNGRDEKCLSPQAEKMRKSRKSQSIADRATFDAEMNSHKKNLRRSIVSAGSQGRDEKLLSDDTEKLRLMLASRRASNVELVSENMGATYGRRSSSRPSMTSAEALSKELLALQGAERAANQRQLSARSSKKALNEEPPMF